MADQPKELFGSAVPQLPNLRAYPSENGIAVGSLEALTADANVAHLTPLHLDAGTGTWGVWSDNGAGADDTLEGFLWAPDAPHAGLLAGETHIQVFKGGLIHAGDIPLPAGEVQATLDALLKSLVLRQSNIVVQGLAGVA